MLAPVISSLSANAARRFGSRIALAIPGVGDYSFAALEVGISRLAGGLAKLGVGPHERVVLHLPNTGDVARMDCDGRLFIVDRKKDVIITAGFNVYPAELEQVLAAHPAVGMVAVASMPDVEKGELAVAYIVLRPNTQVTPTEQEAHCRLNLAVYTVTRRFILVDDLPKTSTGKIKRRALRAKPALVEENNP
jgi:acyl-CoA synthetase (AMP-forming)/AMP-acid ligase II